MKRRLAVIAVFLVLGAVVNVGVIWACQILIYDTSVYFYDSTLREIAPTPNAWPLDVPDSWPEPESARTAGTFWHDMEIHEATHRDDVPTPFLPGTTPSVTTRNWIVREYKWGLPFRSMRSTNAAHSDMQTRPDDSGLVGPINVNWQSRDEPGLVNAIRSGVGLRLPRSMGIELRYIGPRIQRWIVLPLQPIPLGFAVNTLFYASLLAAPMLGIAALKRRRRAKRGLCIGCGYDVSGVDTCPECGRAVDGQPRV